MAAYEVTYEKLVAFLKERHSVRELDDAEERDIRKSFAATFGGMFAFPDRLARKHAEALYAKERPGAYLVLSQPSASFTPHGSCSPITFALSCESSTDDAPLPLGTFSALEPCVVAADFAWAMVHTHEEHLLDGPYFVRAENVF